MAVNANPSLNTDAPLTRDNATFIAVTLYPSAPVLNDPAQLARAHTSLVHMGQVGEMKDVQLLAVADLAWSNVKEEVIEALRTTEGVARVDVQASTKTRAKRDEF